jgi:hypothetical protein
MNETTDIRNLSSQDLAAFGIQAIAYVKPMQHEGRPAYAVHAADGTLVAMTSTRLAAESLVRQSDLEPVSVH